MTRASANNQARVHNGYHYPRSLLTALRSRISFPKFVSEFEDCVDSQFDKYYAVGKILGKVSANQFSNFCNTIGAECHSADGKIKNMFNPSLVEEVFRTKEYAFDHLKVRSKILGQIKDLRVDIFTGARAESIDKENELFKVNIKLSPTLDRRVILSNEVFNCTYSNINHVNFSAGLGQIPLKHELTEMCLVTVPDELKNLGITIMCGPFFSLMPFPSIKGTHSLSHVRYTPHYSWVDGDNSNLKSEYSLKDFSNISNYKKMQRDSMRYLPLMSQLIYKKSIWEIKTVLIKSETDDSRPILFKPNFQTKGYHCIMGGKIDNVYEMVDAIGDIYGS